MSTTEQGTADAPLLLQGTDFELQKFLMLGPFVTGKTAAQQQPKLNAVIDELLIVVPGAETPFEAIAHMSDTHLRVLLERHRVGQYTRITQALRDMATFNYDLRNVSRGDLMTIHGISMKSASFFLVYTQDADHAVWDVHLLRWARAHAWFPDDIPQQTPAAKRYLELEEKFLSYCKEIDQRPHEVDWAVWKRYRRKI